MKAYNSTIKGTLDVTGKVTLEDTLILNQGMSGTFNNNTTLTSATGTEYAYTFEYEVDKLTSGDDYGIFLNKTDTNTAGTSYLARLDVDNVWQFYILQNGNIATKGSIQAQGGLWTAVDNATLLIQGRNFTVADNAVDMATGTISNGTGTVNAVAILPTYNQTGDAAGTDLFINRTETAVGSGSQRLIEARVDGSVVYYVNTSGSVATIGQTQSVRYLPYTANTPVRIRPYASITDGVDGVELTEGSTWSNTTGTVNAVSITPTYNQTSGDSANTDLLVNRTETAVGSGSQYLMELQVDDVNKFSVDTSGIVVGTTIIAPTFYVNNLRTPAHDSTLYFQDSRNYTASANGVHLLSSASITNGSGQFNGIAITPIYTQTGTASATDLLINRTENSVGSGSQYLLDLQVDGVSKFSVDNNGVISPAIGGGGASFTYIEKLNGSLYTGHLGYFVVPAELDGKDIKEVRIVTLGLPTGADVEVDIRKNGTAPTNSIFTGDVPIDIDVSQTATNGVYQAGTGNPTLGTTVGTPGTTIDATHETLTANDVLHVYVSKVGSTLTGADLRVEVVIG